MKRKIDKNLELVRDYIENELNNNDVIEERKKELRVVNDYYFSELTGEKICEKYDISRRTLYKYRDRFNKMLSNNYSYGILKNGNNKLYDFQRNMLKNTLSKSPFIKGFKYLEWNENILREYIEKEFNLSYTNQQYKKFLKNINIDYKKQLDIICLNYDDIIYVDLFNIKTENISYEKEIIAKSKIFQIKKLCYDFLEYLQKQEELKNKIEEEKILNFIHRKVKDINSNSDIIIEIFSDYISSKDEKVKELRDKIEEINKKSYRLITSKNKLEKKLGLYLITGVGQNNNILLESYSGRNFEDNIFNKFIKKLSNNKSIILIVKEDILGKYKLEELIRDKKNIDLIYIKNRGNSECIKKIKNLLENEFKDRTIVSKKSYTNEIKEIINMSKDY
ncbi:hypothetical protein ACSW9K_00405 [Clostridium perfringens]|uniref:hypothetical protein n=3 Tax=Clostridium perfringens TaxID=1502 RepID=UPI00123FE85E|nr:hypothetical protein [Clostridium perfringens]MDU2661041.1 hypothetical protein [Clostridioides difficile]WEV16012.1 hypothetical protein PL325_15620 [Clostridium perfringens D]MBO3408959.1 hypothetical protein [Clostridium perfringens]MCX0400491.1 hypothetical protein [Clostridium perfringens]MDK0885326.1 hypothetical protein [Clostridium perfringens]